MLCPAAALLHRHSRGGLGLCAVPARQRRSGPGRDLHIPHPGGLLEEEALVNAGEALAQALHTATGLLPPGTVVEPVPGTAFPALRLRRPVLDRAVSVIIPTRNEGSMLKACIDSLIAQNPGFDLDILVVDNGTTDPATQEIFLDLEEQGVRILEFSDGFNFSVIISDHQH